MRRSYSSSGDAPSATVGGARSCSRVASVFMSASVDAMAHRPHPRPRGSPPPPPRQPRHRCARQSTSICHVICQKRVRHAVRNGGARGVFLPVGAAERGRTRAAPWLLRAAESGERACLEDASWPVQPRCDSGLAWRASTPSSVPVPASLPPLPGSLLASCYCHTAATLACGAATRSARASVAFPLCAPPVAPNDHEEEEKNGGHRRRRDRARHLPAAAAHVAARQGRQRVHGVQGRVHHIQPQGTPARRLRGAPPMSVGWAGAHGRDGRGRWRAVRWGRFRVRAAPLPAMVRRRRGRARSLALAAP